MLNLLTHAKLSLLMRKYEPQARDQTMHCLCCLQSYHKDSKHKCEGALIHGEAK